jgi:Uma2 family endonuclease
MTMYQPIAAGARVARLRVKDFMLLNDAGSFADYAKSELIEGEIWVVNAAFTRHAKSQFRLARLLANALDAANLLLDVQTALSIELADDTMPEPDIVVSDPHDEGPMPIAKARLLVEISDTTLDTDLGRKARLYAEHGIPEYWVADVEGRVIHQMWSPSGEGYAEQRTVAFGGRIEATTLAGVVMETGGLG